MHNPFDIIIEKLASLENLLAEKTSNEQSKSEIIDRVELCKRLDITEPTAIRWEKKGKIPSFHVGNKVRYNWPKVIEALENNLTVKKKR